MKELKQGWLSPTGEFVECNSYDHIAIARDLANNLNLYQFSVKQNRPLPEDTLLMNAGWVYIGISSFMCHEWRIGWYRKLTFEQVRFLRPYFEESDLPVNEFSVYRWKEEVE